MSYLKREERHAAILEAAVRVTLAEGIMASTVRRIAAEAGMAIGQVHHHFSSVKQLRAEAFLLLTRKSLYDFYLKCKDLPATERLKLALGYPMDEDSVRETHLWNEMMLLAERDTIMHEAYATAISDWHHAVTKVIAEGKTAGSFRAGANVDDIAWRLIGLVCGLDGLLSFNRTSISEAEIMRHLSSAIELELL
ncbi:TetR family transcriptional regulator [Serratia marcescens]|uniref:TetR family transcriptional regulator n=5 Tax=Enterobacterales TaxID=91347 RepID=M4T1Q3_SERMA|nr:MULTISPECIES: TetR family transcriptional regulator [Serratia]AGH62542.1 TetR family transcriptional regulator [Serratia marcescens]AGZ03787.1 TetR family transcriptional regulator [Serratia marcescens]AGZ03826.1 TetR family transcriptional regulator [Serratia marcescens]AGZ03861.1 TetR family transcriptional regulator [Serratia marcescens]AVN35093.1 TetR family transcriptional regulator [Serratia marcescens]